MHNAAALEMSDFIANTQNNNSKYVEPQERLLVQLRMETCFLCRRINGGRAQILVVK